MSPEAEALVAAAVRGPNQATLAAARVVAEAHAAVAAVQAGVDARRAEALAAVQAESEGRRDFGRFESPIMCTWDFIPVPEAAIFSRPVVRKTQNKFENSHRKTLSHRDI